MTKAQASVVFPVYEKVELDSQATALFLGYLMCRKTTNERASQGLMFNVLPCTSGYLYIWNSPWTKSGHFSDKQHLSGKADLVKQRREVLNPSPFRSAISARCTRIWNENNVKCFILVFNGFLLVSWMSQPKGINMYQQRRWNVRALAQEHPNPAP